MDDLISRQAAIDKLNEFDWQELYLPIHFKQFVLDELPAVQPEQKTGQWLDTRKEYGDFDFMCSNCQLLCRTNQYNYCPNCGAKMESEGNK